MTQLSNEKPDPVKPVSELVPSIPLHISRAIQRAMSLKMMQRFATVQEFWQAVQGEPGQQPHIAEALNSIVVSPSTSEVSGKTGETSSQPLQAQQLPARRSRKRFLIPVLPALLMMVGIGAGLWGFTVIERNYVATPTADRSASSLHPPALSPIAPHCSSDPGRWGNSHARSLSSAGRVIFWHYYRSANECPFANDTY